VRVYVLCRKNARLLYCRILLSFRLLFGLLVGELSIPLKALCMSALHAAGTKLIITSPVVRRTAFGAYDDIVRFIKVLPANRTELIEKS